MNVMPNLEILLKSLEQSTKLSRLSLVCPSDRSWNISSEEFSNRFLSLCTNLKSLVALFGHFHVHKVVCREATTRLKKKMKEERPAFRVDIQPSDVGFGRLEEEYHSQVLTVLQSDVLTRIESQVALFPINCRSYCQSISQNHVQLTNEMN